MRATSGPHTSPRTAALVLLISLTLLFVVLRALLTTPMVRSITLHGSPQAVALLPHSAWAVVIGEDATVRLVDLAAGHVVRTLLVSNAPAVPSLALALDDATHHLFVTDPRDGFASSLVHVFDSRDGTPRATVPVGRGAIAMAVDARRGRVFVANQAAKSVSVLDSRTAHVRRTVSLGATPIALAVDQRRGRAFVLEWHSRRSYGFRNGYGPITGRLGVLDTRRETLRRTVAVGAGPAALAVDARRGRVFVANQDDGTVSVLDAASGAVLRTTAVGRRPTALAVDGRRGLVYVVNVGEGTLSLLDAVSGRLLQTRRLAGLATPASPFALPDVLAVDEARERVYLSTAGDVVRVAGAPTLRGHGTLYVLDARTGAVRRRIAVGVTPQAIAVAASGRVVVANAGGVVRAPEGWLAPWLRRLGGWLPWLGQQLHPQPTVIQVPGSLSVIDAPA